MLNKGPLGTFYLLHNTAKIANPLQFKAMNHEVVYEELKSLKNVTERKMFGHLGLFVNGHCFIMLLESEMLFRLHNDLPLTEAAFRHPGAHYFDPEGTGKQNKKWVCVPYDSFNSKTRIMAEACYVLTSQLAPKTMKVRKKSTRRVSKKLG